MNYDGIHIHITDRENDVLQLVLNGKSNKQIASLLNISEYTVRDHVSSLLHKNQVKTRIELILLCNDILLIPHKKNGFIFKK